MIPFLFCFILSCVSATSFNCSIPESYSDRRKDKTKWTIAQYNVEWLFTEPYKDCPGDGCAWNTTSQEFTHLDYVAQVIQKLDADTIHLCEVQSCTQLNQLNSLLEGFDYVPYLIQGTDSYTGQNVALLTRIDPILPLTRNENRVDYPVDDNNCQYDGDAGSTGVSKHLITTFSLNGQNISLVGAHFLSNPNDPTACVKREAQSLVLQQTINSIIPYNDVIVMGDFNDFDPLILDINANLPNSRVLNIIRGYEGHAKYELFSVGNLTFQNNRYTDWYDPNEDCIVETSEYSTIDHIFLTKHLYDHVDKILYYHDYEQGCNINNSDHYPIIVTIQV